MDHHLIVVTDHHLIFIVLVIIMLTLLFRRRGLRTAHGFFTRRCPGCRELMASRASACPHCCTKSKPYLF